MSQLWNQIGQARREHLTSCYPGDLVGELLPPAQQRGSRAVLWRGVRAMGAVAAAVVVAWFWPEPFVSPLRAAGVLPAVREQGSAQVVDAGMLPAVPQFPTLPVEDTGGE